MIGLVVDSYVPRQPAKLFWGVAQGDPSIHSSAHAAGRDARTGGGPDSNVLFTRILRKSNCGTKAISRNRLLRFA
ncbi:hypothetical protein Taro_046711 [Colocasia esculenta]|uniref:Uncharacterized protein n=1 Tax=Colocasia esculenta TaxID=4460 RepID=A0A843X5W8_COLES|nr:hypothetical protein [Colocasia esculenta]